MDENICWRWCCYSDNEQCTKMVIKNKKYVRCKRNGKFFCKIRKKYFCKKHIKCNDNELKYDETETMYNETKGKENSSKHRYSYDSMISTDSSSM